VSSVGVTEYSFRLTVRLHRNKQSASNDCVSCISLADQQQRLTYEFGLYNGSMNYE